MLKQVKDRDGYIIEIVEESAEKTATKKEETPKKEGEQACNDKPKKKLHPMKIILPVVGGAAVIAGIIAGSVKIKHNSIENKYEALKSDTTIRTSSMYDLINPGRTSLDELLDQNVDQYVEYERFRDLLNAKRRCLDPKEYKLKEYITFDITYEELSVERIDEMNDLYYELIKEMDTCTANRDQAGYDNAKEQLDGICIELNTYHLVIEEYEKHHGAALVEAIANKVLASKVIDAEELDPNKVSNIKSTFDKDGDMSIKFDYKEGSKTYNYSSKFENDDEDLVENLSKDMAEENLLDAIHETKILAADHDYDGLSVKKRK